LREPNIGSAIVTAEVTRLRPDQRPELWITYGPSVDEPDVLRRVIMAGVDGVRLTFSYGDVGLQCERAAAVKAAAAAAGRAVRVIADLQGEKCRIAKIGDLDQVKVCAGRSIEFTAGTTAGTEGQLRLPLQQADHVALFSVGDVVIAGDGEMLLDVVGTDAEGVRCVPREDGVLRPGRGLAIQGSNFTPSSMTTKDREDLRALLGSIDFDAVALSFVSGTEAIDEAREEIGESRGLEVIAKIETAKGVARAGRICADADAVMAARGDLALSMPWTALATGVERIAGVACEHSKAWILATQIVESMERFDLPSRAEICDLSHWLATGAAAVMLSRETAFGTRPVESVAAVAELIAARAGGREQ
jgi:pyruvate kinase